MENKYEITINSDKRKIQKFSYQYSNYKKPVILEIALGFIRITFFRPKLEKHQDVFRADNYIVNDAIKKAVLLHTLCHLKPLVVKKIEVSVNDSKQEVDNVFYSMVGAAKRQIPKEFANKAVINHILNTTKTHQKDLTAALYAYVYSKTKEYETEKFMYLWMAINGLYGALCEDKNKTNEQAQIQRLAYLIDESAGRITRKKSTAIIEPILQQIHKDKCISERVKEIAVYIGEKGKSIAPEAMLILWAPYHVRCTLFHASKPIILFSFQDEYELTYLKGLNDYLEQYLDNNLHKFYDTEYRKSKQLQIKENEEVFK